MSGLRLALIEDQALVRQGLYSLLQSLPGIEVIECLADGSELLALLTGPDSEHIDPAMTAAAGLDLIVSDLRMPGVDGLALTRELRRRGIDLPVILITTFDEAELPLAAAEAGAQGFLRKDASPEDLHEAILAVARGETLLQPVATDPIRARWRFREQSVPDERFSEREIAILRLLAGGYSNREIARAIHLAEGTVKNYVSDILDKLDSRDRTRAVLKAISLRII
jgi:DNA-binding NarL/FixJ family response regulator